MSTDKLVEALRAIAATPHEPFPDAEGHSWEAFGRAVFGAWCDCNRIAREAIAAHAQAQKAEPVAEVFEIGIHPIGRFPQCKLPTGTKLYTAPPADAKDAARYRFLRACKSDDIYVMAFDPEGDAPCCGGEIMDRTIDAAMAREGG